MDNEVKVSPAAIVTYDALEDFGHIKERWKVGDEEFRKAVSFAVDLTSGAGSREEAYKKHVDSESKHPIRDSGKYVKRRYVEALLKQLYAANYIIWSDRRNHLLGSMYNMALDRSIADKNRIDAAKVFLDHTKPPESIEVEHTIDISSESKQAMNAFLTVMEKVTNGEMPMLDRDGNFVDAEVIQ